MRGTREREGKRDSNWDVIYERRIKGTIEKFTHTNNNRI